MFEDRLARLNDQQRAFVMDSSDGHSLVLAGAGSGKTTALTMRISRLINSGVNPDHIIAVTFTNKSARVLNSKIGELSLPVSWVGTFHGLSLRFLRIHGNHVGLEDGFVVVDGSDQLSIVKKLVREQGMEDSPSSVFQKLQMHRMKGKVPSDDNMRFIYNRYEEHLRRSNACDFDDLLRYFSRLIKEHKDLWEEYGFKYLFVDEYQDTNPLQYNWISAMAKDLSICCVGDEDQAIYGWRGADIQNILRFQSDFSGAKIYRLEQNYRSTGHILSVASGLISKNKQRLGKSLWSDKGDGFPLVVKGFASDLDMHDGIASTINEQKCDLSEIAILLRAGSQTRAIEERLMRAKIPYNIVGQSKFYDRAEMRDALAFLRIIVNERDVISFERALSSIKGVGEKTIVALRNTAYDMGISWREALREIECRPGLISTLHNFADKLESWQKMHDERRDIQDIVRLMLDESGIRTRVNSQQLEDFDELIDAVEKFKDLCDFLDHVSVMNESAYQGVDAVVMMTMHAAKGLEFPVVIMPGWEEDSFPHYRAVDEGSIEEERRLAYVAITRAMQRAYIFFAWQRQFTYGVKKLMPSRFIYEIPKEHTEQNLGNVEQQFKIGDRVHHGQLGFGTVRSAGGTVSVCFDKDRMVRKILRQFIRHTY